MNYYVIESLNSGDNAIKWFFNGKEKNLSNQRELNSFLSEICETVYPLTPVFRNEMVDKTRISGTISYARKKLFTKLLNESSKSDFGLESNKFPPERTIFLSLIKSTGIYDYKEGKASLKRPLEPTFGKLWDACESYFNETINSKKPISDFICFLKSNQFKLKQGFIDFWVPLFLIANKDSFALFFQNKTTRQLTYIPEINEEVLDLINRVPQDYLIRKFNLTAQRLLLFNKYREILNQIEQDSFSNNSFIETFRPFLVFYKNLPEYSLKTKRLSKSALKFRDSIVKSIDPEDIFFTDFPNALGYNLDELVSDEKKIEDFALAIKENIREINSAYDLLINEIELFINNEILGNNQDFPKNRELLRKRYTKLRKDLLKPASKVFYNRIDTVLDDRRSWINSIAQACIGKTLDKISDDEISLLKNRILDNIWELDNYTELSKENVDIEREEVIKLEVTSFLKGLSKKNIRIPKSKMRKIANFEKSIKEQLKNNDKTFNIALLTKLLQNEINDES